MPRKPAKAASNRTNSAAPTSTQIERYYAQEIQSGRIAPGTKLPSNPELAAAWNTSCSIVQKALLSLVAMGLVDRTKRRGTFVREGAERALVGILLGPSLNASTASFYRVLTSAIIDELNTDFLSCRIYDGLSTPDPNKRDTIIHHLQIDQKYHTFRGFVHIVSLPLGISIDDVVPPNTAKVIFDDGRADNDFVLDRRDLIMTTAKALLNKGCTRIAIVVSKGELFCKHEAFYQALLKEIEKETGAPSLSLLSVPLNPAHDFAEVDTDRFLSNYIATTPPKALPDGLIFTDDTAARGGIMALLKNGIRIPEQITIATLTNEGVDIHYSVPVIRYEYPVISLGHQIADLLRNRMAGKDLPGASPTSIHGKLALPQIAGKGE